MVALSNATDPGYIVRVGGALTAGEQAGARNQGNDGGRNFQVTSKTLHTEEVLDITQHCIVLCLKNVFSFEMCKQNVLPTRSTFWFCRL